MRLFTFREIRRYGLYATDGLVGLVKDFFFDDADWVVRYLVADTGGWLTGQLVLISPHSVGHADAEEASFQVSLTKQQVEDSPPIAADEPVSRQMEEALAGHFQWPVYWTGHLTGGVPLPAGSAEHKSDSADASRVSGDPNLRSSREVIGYRIEASDGEIGHVHDFIVDIDAWRIVQMIVDTRNWLPGRKVLIAPSLVSDIRWSNRHVRVALRRNVIKESPEYDSSQPLSEGYLKQLTDYYICPACIGLSVVRCDFCVGTGLASIDTVPEGLRVSVVIRRAKLAMSKVKKMLGQPMPEATADSPSKALKQAARYLLDLNKLIGVLENTVAFTREQQLEISDSAENALAQASQSCIQIGSQTKDRVRSVVRRMAALAQKKAKRASRNSPRRNAAIAAARFYQELSRAPAFSGTSLEHPFLWSADHRSTRASPPTD